MIVRRPSRARQYGEDVMTATRTFSAAFGAAFALVHIAIGGASAQSSTAPGFACGGSPPQMVTVAPIPKYGPIDFDNRGADCAMWQTFFYLNWPALPGNRRGIPDTAAKFGGPGPTVWETYKTNEQVFLAEGTTPPPWDPPLQMTALAPDIAARIGSGSVRMLRRTSKVSRTVIENIARNPQAQDSTFLNSLRQADGNILWDQQKRPVFYEIAMNKTQFEYIYNNHLYNASQQGTYIQKTNIILPSESIELKAAWKVMTAAEVASGRFHVVDAYLYDPLLPPTKVGLVGLHVFMAGGDATVGLWGTFAQIDNAPIQPAGPVPGRQYTFFNRQCAGCPLNDKYTNPTQVVQSIPDDQTAAGVTTQAQGIIEQYNKQNNITSPWQYYKLVNVQWSPKTVTLSTPVPIKLPLPMGAPSTDTLMNAVLETFMQQPGTSCLQCHATYANSAADPTVGSGFSFMFGNAQAPSQ
jgi:hypothetical protein